MRNLSMRNVAQQKRKQCRYKPGSVPHGNARAAPVIYLLCRSPCNSSVLPSAALGATPAGRGASGRAGNPLRRFTRTCSLQTAQPARSPARLVGSYPAFSPLPAHPGRHAGGCFLLPDSAVAGGFYFQKWSAMCCPDFPPAAPQGDPWRGQRQTAALLSGGEISYFGPFWQTSLYIFLQNPCRYNVF